MGSSVRIFRVVDLWKTFFGRNVCSNHTPTQLCNFEGSFSFTIIG